MSRPDEHLSMGAITVCTTIWFYDPRFGNYEIVFRPAYGASPDAEAKYEAACCRAFDEESSSHCARIKGHADEHVSCRFDEHSLPIEVTALWSGPPPGPASKTYDEHMAEAIRVAFVLVSDGRTALLEAGLGHLLLAYDRALDAAHQAAMANDAQYAAAWAMLQTKDGPEEDPADAPLDAPRDVPLDRPADAPLDAPLDLPREAPRDQPADAPTDAPTDTPDAAHADTEPPAGSAFAGL